MLKHVSLYMAIAVSLWAATAMAIAQLAPPELLQTWIARQIQEGARFSLLVQAGTTLILFDALTRLYDQLSEAVASYAHPIAQ